jgi:hypothetical protein
MRCLEDTLPSDYDLDARWYCTIGKAELESDAWEITRQCQLKGDKWQLVEIVYPDWHFPRRRVARMKEYWLERLQTTRKRRPGPPELLIGPRSGVLQLRYPEGRVQAACFCGFSEGELEALRPYALQT